MHGETNFQVTKEEKIGGIQKVKNTIQEFILCHSGGINILPAGNRGQ